MNTLAKRFWTKVGKTGWCWLWRGATRNGYGVLHGPLSRHHVIYAHRLSWELANGPIADGLFVLHRCDIRPCVNPAHLFLGTQADNLRDAGHKGRIPGSRLKGATNPNAKLTDDDVRAIRAGREQGATLLTLAHQFHVSRSAICDITRRNVWKHVT